MAHHMKSWHIVVMDGWKIKEDILKFNVAEANELFAKKKEEYDAINLALREADPQTKVQYAVKREWY